MAEFSRTFMTPTESPPPVGYSHIAKVSNATLIYLAGQVPMDAAGNLIGAGDFRAQAEQVFRPMLLEQYADAVSKGGGVGIADAVLKEILRMQGLE